MRKKIPYNIIVMFIALFCIPLFFVACSGKPSEESILETSTVSCINEYGEVVATYDSVISEDSITAVCLTE